MNRTLALTQDHLMEIDKPARYIGGERGSILKDKKDVKVRFAMCFPDVYEIGMSHLGIQILYDMLNSYPDTWCERVYSPWVDGDKLLRENNIPLFCLESQEPVRDMDFLGITLQYELCYTNILQVLDLSHIPLMADDRTWEHPIVIGGGPCSYNPEPIADFFDLFYIGEGEVSYRELLDVYINARKQDMSRRDFLIQASKVPGIYVPSLYKTTYNNDGTIESFKPIYADVPAIVKRQVVRDMDSAPYPINPVIPYIKVTQDRACIEMMRGCIRGCRFCQAGMIYRPVRPKSVDTLNKTARGILESTGHEELNLSSLSTSDYKDLPEFMDSLLSLCNQNHVNISLPSLRIDAFSLDVMSRVQDVKKSSLTFAPEAGSQRMRDVINKGLTEEVILNGAIEAFKGGWNKVKLYFMLGLPTETQEDIKGIAILADKIAMAYYDTVPKEKRQGRCQISVSTSFFVPKPFTPFQWAAQDKPESFLEKAYLTKDIIREMLNQKSIRYSYHEAEASLLEAVLARGDRRLSKVILRAYKKGCIFDAWSEFYDHENWMESFMEEGIDPEFYASRVRSLNEILPWDFIDIGVKKEFLINEWNRALEGQITPNCKMECSHCGAAAFGCGVCVDKREGDHKEGYNSYEMKPVSKPVTEGLETTDIRIEFSKTGDIRYTGHLDLMRYFQKAVRRSKIPVAYSAGFSPHQIMSFAHPLGVGTESLCEYMDLRLVGTPDPDKIKDSLNRVMNEGVYIKNVAILPPKAQNAMASVRKAAYFVFFRKDYVPDFWVNAQGDDKAREYIRDFINQKEIPFEKTGKKGTRTVNLKEGLFEIKTISGLSDLGEEINKALKNPDQGNGDVNFSIDTQDIYPVGIYLLVDASSSGNIKPDAVIKALCSQNGHHLPDNALRIIRTRLILENQIC